MSAAKDFVESKLEELWLEVLPVPEPPSATLLELMRLAAHYRRLEWVRRLLYLVSQQPRPQWLLTECLRVAHKEGPSRRVLLLFGPVPAPEEIELQHRVLMMREEAVDVGSLSASQLKRVTAQAIRKRRQLLVSHCMARQVELESVHLEWIVASCHYQIAKLDKVLKFISAHPALNKRLARRLATVAIKGLATEYPWLRYDNSPRLAQAWQDGCWLADYMSPCGPVDKQAVLEQVLARADKSQAVLERLLESVPDKEVRRLCLGRLVGLCLEAGRSELAAWVLEHYQHHIQHWVRFMQQLLTTCGEHERTAEHLVALLRPRRLQLRPLEVSLALIGLTSEPGLRMRLLRLWFRVLRQLELGMHWRPLLRALLRHPGFTDGHNVQRPRLTELVELLLPGLVKIDTPAWHSLCRLEGQSCTEEIIDLVGETLERL